MLQLWGMVHFTFTCCVAVADEDFVISDDDVDYHELSSGGSEGPGRRRRGSVDSDFIADEDDSGSDWESSSRKPVKPKVCRTFRSSVFLFATLDFLCVPFSAVTLLVG